MATRGDGKGGTQSCTHCGNPAVYLCRITGEHFCEGHFLSRFEDTVWKALRDCAMIRDGDRIGVALSGGKDSSVLLAVLHTLPVEYRGVSLVAITVDEGICGYREETIASAVRLTERLGIPHRVIPFSDIFGNDLDTLVKGREQIACSICGTLRRRALNILAKEEGATKLATGHCLDDEAQSAMMNYLRGDLRRTLSHLSPDASRHFVPRIKPLRYLSEREVMVYGIIGGLVHPLPECPYTRFALRADVRRMLGKMEFLHPGTLMKILLGQESLARSVSIPEETAASSFCHECGEPSAGVLCATCMLLHSLGSDKREK
jgi:uncharacterized protein (TIGR00269 family)